MRQVTVLAALLLGTLVVSLFLFFIVSGRLFQRSITASAASTQQVEVRVRGPVLLYNDEDMRLVTSPSSVQVRVPTPKLVTFSPFVMGSLADFNYTPSSSSSRYSKRSRREREQWQKRFNMSLYENATIDYDAYGKDVIIKGLEEEGECMIRPNARIAGTHNTGTNYAFKQIFHNCPKVQWQVRWSTREMQKFLRFDSKDPNVISNKTEVELQENGWVGKHANIGNWALDDTFVTEPNLVVITMIRDPLTWLKSMCIRSYSTKFSKRTCPNPVKGRETIIPISPPKERPVDRRNSNVLFTKLPSPIHVWNQFYRSHLNLQRYQRALVSSPVTKNLPGTKFVPKIVFVRMEDMLFHPNETTAKICSCLLNSQITPNMISIFSESDEGRSNLGMQKKYGNSYYRFQGYTKEDLLFMNQTLDHELLDMFGYEAFPKFPT